MMSICDEYTRFGVKVLRPSCSVPITNGAESSGAALSSQSSWPLSKPSLPVPVPSVVLLSNTFLTLKHYTLYVETMFFLFFASFLTSHQTSPLFASILNSLNTRLISANSSPQELSKVFVQEWSHWLRLKMLWRCPTLGLPRDYLDIVYFASSISTAICKPNMAIESHL